MHRHQRTPTQIVKNQANVIPPKKTYKTPVTHPKETGIYKLLDKKIQNNHLKETQWKQENTGKTTKWIKKAMHEQNEKFNNNNKKKT